MYDMRCIANDLTVNYFDDGGEDGGRRRLKMCGVSLEGDYMLFLDNEDDRRYFVMSVYTRDFELAYRVRYMTSVSCVCDVMEWLGVRRLEDGTMQYKYDGVWYDAEKDDVCA